MQKAYFIIRLPPLVGTGPECLVSKKIPYLRTQKFFQPLCHNCYNFHGYSVNYVIVKHFACSGGFFFLHKKRPFRVCVCVCGGGGGWDCRLRFFLGGLGHV